MARTEHYYTKFEAGQFYHVYNRSVDLKPMFRNNANCIFFLKKYDFYLSEVIDTYAYCLLGNHFHLLIKIKSLEKLAIFRLSHDYKDIPGVHEIVSHQFRKFFQSYSMAFNKSFERVGTLFQTPFKRALVDSPDYLRRIIYYIHYNPQHHNLIADFRDWEWSSYKRFLLDKSSHLSKQEVFDCYNSKGAFLKYHYLDNMDDFSEVIFMDDIY